MHQHSHRRREVVDPVELALGEGAEVPHAGEDLLERLVDPVLLRLTRLLSLGVVKPRAAEAG